MDNQSPERISLHDKYFRKHIAFEEIALRTAGIARQIQADYADKAPVFLVILNGAFFFASELFRNLSIAGAEISFVKIASYSGTSSTGKMKQLIGLDTRITGRHIVILEDIVDSGLTVHELSHDLQESGAASVSIASMILKPDALKYPVEVAYAAFRTPNDFLVGFGLDYDQLGRLYRDIYIAE